VRLAIALSAALVLLGAGVVRAETLFSLYPIMQDTEGYNDNITLSANHHLSDFVNTGVLGFALNYGGAARTGSLQYDTVLQTFASNSRFDSYGSTNFVTLVDQENLSPDLTMFVNDSVVVGSITGGLLVGNTGAVSPQVAQAAVTNTQTETNDFNVELKRQFSESWTGTLAVTQDFYATGFQSSYTQGGSASLLYALMPQVQTGFGYTFTDYRYSNIAPSEAHSPQLLVNWDPTKRLSVNLAGGFVVIDSFGGRGSLLVRPSGTGTVSFRGERWKVSLSGGQNASSTGGLGGTGLNRSVSGVITYALQRHTSLNIGATYSDFVGGGANGSFVSYGAGIATQPRRWLTLYAAYAGYQNSVSSATTAAAGAFTVAPGNTATSNSYSVGARIYFDAVDFAL
jgi:hypothetical protein